LGFWRDYAPIQEVIDRKRGARDALEAIQREASQQVRDLKAQQRK
jgi:hypothetical protein